jgi:hypothetical protein
LHEAVPWLALAGLGAFHGVNPAMGWLFAVALGLHRQSRRVVWLALVPIALGHALSVAVVIALALAAGRVVDSRAIETTAGIGLLAWAAWHAASGHRRRVRVGMRTGLLGLFLWSFLMATSHGAGLMLLPIVLPLGDAAGHAHGVAPTGTLATGLAALAVHTAAMLAATAAVAIPVYEWLGVAFLRRGWLNLDLVWTAALVVAGLLLLL